MSQPGRRSTIALQNEIVMALGDLTHLQEENAELKAENATLREEVQLLKATILTMSSPRPGPISRQPTEILCLIFNYTFPPDCLLDSSLAQGPKSPWSIALRDKKSVILVCRAWWFIGVQYLYESVALRRIHQFFPLIRTLQRPNNREELGHLVKIVVIECLIPDIHWPLRAMFQRLLIYCPRIKRVTYAPSFGPYVSDDHLHRIFDPHPDIVVSLTASLTHLTFSKAIPLCKPLIDILNKATRLESLHLCLAEMPQRQACLSFVDVSLPALESITVDGNLNFGIDALTRWSTPRLTRVTFGSSGTRVVSCRRHFLSVKGGSLKFLSLPSDRYDSEGVQSLITHCPILEHLEFCGQSVFPSGHPSLQWIDVWSSRETLYSGYNADAVTSRLGWEERMAQLAIATFPSLRRARLIDGTLSIVPNLTSALPPERGGGEEPVRLSLPGATVWETRDRVLREYFLPGRDSVCASGVPTQLDDIARDISAMASDDSDDESFSSDSSEYESTTDTDEGDDGGDD